MLPYKAGISITEDVTHPFGSDIYKFTFSILPLLCGLLGMHCEENMVKSW